jgi:hypothetical protein
MRGNGRADTTARRWKFRDTAVVFMSAAVLFGVVGAGAGAAQAAAAVPASTNAPAVSPPTDPPGLCNPGETGQDRVGLDGKPGVCVPFGLPGSFAEAKRLEELASDPASGGEATYGSTQKARAALGLEKAGLLPAPVRRDPTGATDFIDGRGLRWNAHEFNSKFSSRQGGHDIRTPIIEIGVDLLNGKNVILITENLSTEATNELNAVVDSAGLGDHVLLWPGVSTSGHARMG